MQFASAVSQARALEALHDELAEGVLSALDAPVDLGVLFFTAPLSPAARLLSEELRRRLQPRVWLGVSAEGVIGGDVEIERQPGAALLVGSLPGVELRPFHVGSSEWHELLANGERLQQRVGTGEGHRGQLLLGDPFTTPVDPLLSRLDETRHAPSFGGMASGGGRPGSNVLLLQAQGHTEGLIGLGFGGAVEIGTVVSQGCRPVGEPMVITRVENDLVMELGRRPALPVVQEMLGRLTPAEMELLRTSGLFVGVVINEYQEQFGRGDFLVRGVLGGNPETGAVAIGDHVRAGQTIQLHVRDAATATEDLVSLLEPHAAKSAPAGALLFSCNGRGTRMFDDPHHDVRTTHASLPGLPVAGFFAMGELGPVGGKSFIHGHTASLALFSPR
jgi:small ligand-binding sensory domain FIST